MAKVVKKKAVTDFVRPIEFELLVTHPDADLVNKFLKKVPDLERVSYSVERFTGENGDQTSVHFKCSWTHNLAQLTELISAVFRDGCEE
jgi:hypothetical protein